MVRSRSTRRGASRVGCLLQIAALAALGYIATIAGEDALNFYRFQDAMRNETRFAANRSDQEIKSRLRAFTDSLNLPLSAKDVNVVRQANHIRIWSRYDKVVKLPLNYTRIVHLRPSAEADF